MSKNELKNQLLELLDTNPDVLEKIARRLERTVLFKELGEFRKEVNRRFEAMDRRFEAMDRRFEAMDRRFEAMDRRFEAMDRRFEAMKDWIGVVVGGFQRRAGRSLEEAVAGTLRVALRMKDVSPDAIKMRQKVVDTDGMIGPPGRTYEYDIFVSDGQTWLFEVKATPDEEDIDKFADKCELVAKKLNLGHVQKVLVTLEKTHDLLRRCEERGVMLA